MEEFKRTVVIDVYADESKERRIKEEGVIDLGVTRNGVMRQATDDELIASAKMRLQMANHSEAENYFYEIRA